MSKDQWTCSENYKVTLPHLPLVEQGDLHPGRPEAQPGARPGDVRARGPRLVPRVQPAVPGLKQPQLAPSEEAQREAAGRGSALSHLPGICLLLIKSSLITIFVMTSWDLSRIRVITIIDELTVEIHSL